MREPEAAARPARSEGLGSGVAVIALTGILLGLGYNQLSLMSRPPRGLEWIGRERELPSLEQAMAQRQGAPAATASQAAAEPPPEPARAPAGEVAPRVEAPAPSRPGPSPAAPPATPTRPASAVDPDDPLGGLVEEPAVDEGGVPEIPDLDRPFQVELATVKRFFDARAALIVDAREPDEFAEGHIPGAVNVPYSTAASDPGLLESLDSGERPFIVYCGGGTCEVSMNLAETLVYQMAKRKVLVYMGGYPEWVAAGYPVEPGSGEEVRP